MDKALDILLAFLKGKGLQHTRQREEILVAFMKAGKHLSELCRRCDSALNHAVELRKLGGRDRPLQLAHAVVEGHGVVGGILISIAPRLVDAEEGATCQIGVVRDHETAFTGCDVLALLEAKAADIPHTACHWQLLWKAILFFSPLFHYVTKLPDT